MSAIIKHSNPNFAKQIYERFGKMGKKEVAVGFPAGKAQAYPDGTEVAFVAACHVYGLGVPRRDFMGLALDGIREKAMPIMHKVVQAKTENEAKALLNAAGLVAQKEIQKAIVDLEDPPLAPETIERKGSDNPLIDTGHMLQSVTYIVRDKK